MRLSRAGAVTVVIAATGAVATWPRTMTSATALTESDFPTALLALGELALALASGWVLLIALAGLARVRVPGVPRALQALLFVAVVSGGGAAHAEPQHDLDGLALPDRPVVTAPAVTAAPVTPTTASVEVVVVRPGDTLWAIAARSLPSAASDHDVADAVTRWHRANRSVIGSDPDLILPGHQLRPPHHDPPRDEDPS